MKQQGFIFGLILASLTLIGSGCLPEPAQNSSIEEAAASLSLLVGDQYIIKPTVLGLSGQVVEWFGGEEEYQTITVTDWHTGGRASIEWERRHQVETAESIATREAYDGEYAQAPIGIEIPTEPEPMYEDAVVRGSLSTANLGTGDTLLLPERWTEGDMGTVSETLIWLSEHQYDELVNTRSTTLSLGLFDASLSSVEKTAEQVTQATDVLSELLAPLAEYGWIDWEPPQTEAVEIEDKDVTTVEADGDWQTYYVKINGDRTGVRAIKASNAFATYTILANPENPLVLEVQLTPLAQGSLDFGGLNLSESFGGYEITEITKTQSE